MENDSIVSLPTLARELKVSQLWIRREAEAGRLPGIKAGNGRFIFSRKAVERALLERAEKSEAAQ
jgi:hypothetical protein